MDKPKSLQARVQALEDIEEIRKLKARCWFSSDRKQWDEFGECFTEDAILDVPPETHLVGRKEIVESLSTIMASFTTIHQGHHADITLTGDTTARATWAMYDNVQNKDANLKMQDYGVYEDEFVKENGKWKIKKSTRTNLLTEIGKID
jgi:hypothetical protein